jgi:DNA-binding transcriptional LysR family regulator
VDRLDELAIFAAIVEAGSLAAAGRRLRRSPPAVTRALASLEERAGVRLVERTTRRLAPTEAGRELAEEARRLVSDYDTALTKLANAPIKGLVRITAPAVFGRRHVTPMVASFLDRHPATEVELVLNDRNIDLIDNDIHVAVRIGPLADSTLVARRVGSVRRILVAAPAYLERRGTPVSPADLAGHDAIFGLPQRGGDEWRFGPGDRGPLLRFVPRLRVNDVSAMLHAVRAGRGIGRPLSYQVARDLDAGVLVRLLRDFEPAALPVQLVVPGGRHMAPRVRAFLDHAVEAFAELSVIRGND